MIHFCHLILQCQFNPSSVHLRKFWLDSLGVSLFKLWHFFLWFSFTASSFPALGKCQICKMYTELYRNVTNLSLCHLIILSFWDSSVFGFSCCVSTLLVFPFLLASFCLLNLNSIYQIFPDTSLCHIWHEARGEFGWEGISRHNLNLHWGVHKEKHKIFVSCGNSDFLTTEKFKLITLIS